jgi:hypothetical protein
MTSLRTERSCSGWILTVHPEEGDNGGCGRGMALATDAIVEPRRASSGGPCHSVT